MITSTVYKKVKEIMKGILKQRAKSKTSCSKVKPWHIHVHAHFNIYKHVHVHVHVHKNKVMLGHDTKRTFRYFSDFAQKIKMPKQAANQCESFAFLQLSIDRLFAHIFQFFHFNLKFSFKKVKYWQKIKFENSQSNEK